MTLTFDDFEATLDRSNGGMCDLLFEVAQGVRQHIDVPSGPMAVLEIGGAGNEGAPIVGLCEENRSAHR